MSIWVGLIILIGAVLCMTVIQDICDDLDARKHDRNRTKS
jgi:hypothetical protein